MTLDRLVNQVQIGKLKSHKYGEEEAEERQNCVSVVTPRSLLFAFHKDHFLRKKFVATLPYALFF